YARRHLRYERGRELGAVDDDRGRARVLGLLEDLRGAPRANTRFEPAIFGPRVHGRFIASEQEHGFATSRLAFLDERAHAGAVSEPDGGGRVGAKQDARLRHHATRASMARVASRSSRGCARSLEYSKSGGSGLPGRTRSRVFELNWNSGQITSTSSQSLVRRASSAEI